MPKTADFVIIGGGITGASTALHLAAQAAGKILLLEKSHLGAGSTGKSGAILRQHYSRETTIRMARSSLQFYSSFQEEYGVDIGFRQPGLILVVASASRQALQRNIDLQNSLGVEVQLLGVDDLRRLERRGRFGDETIAAWEPEAGYVNPVRTVFGFARAAQDRGAEIETGVGVAEIRSGTGSGHLVCTEKGDRIETERVLVAAGPWARSLLQKMELDYPLQAIRPEQAYLEPPSTFGDPTAIFIDLQSGVYWKPEDAGWTRVGELSYDNDAPVSDPDHYDEGVSDAFIQLSRKAIARRLPDFEHATSWGGCGALYTITPDAHPLIGELPEREGIYLASGFSGHGFKMGPSVGKGLAGLMTETDPGELDPKLFAVDRLRRSRPIEVPYRYGILG